MVCSVGGILGKRETPAETCTFGGGEVVRVFFLQLCAYASEPRGPSPWEVFY